MNFHQAAKIAVLKQIVGGIIVIFATLSTFISLLNFLSAHTVHSGPAAVVTDFIHFLINLLQHNTHFLQLFWLYSPKLGELQQLNLEFWLIYALIFIGLALQGAGARMWRQSRFIKEKVEDMGIIESIKCTGALSQHQLTQQLELPNQPFYRQYYRLYLLPILGVGLLGIGFYFVGLLK